MTYATVHSVRSMSCCVNIRTKKIAKTVTSVFHEFFGETQKAHGAWVSFNKQLVEKVLEIICELKDFNDRQNEKSALLCRFCENDQREKNSSGHEMGETKIVV